SLGFIAQEVEEIFPELVITDTAGYKNLDYSKLTAVLAKAVQELYAQVEDLAAQLAAIATWFTDGKFRVQSDVCVDDVCVTKEQFKALLQNGGGTGEASGGSSATSADSGTFDSATTEPASGADAGDVSADTASESDAAVSGEGTEATTEAGAEAASEAEVVVEEAPAQAEPAPEESADTPDAGADEPTSAPSAPAESAPEGG
ncbi:tail fiber domain-containing protein, partial [Candidatus Kaiserbacteria bacterium]|nr:tail fiber domain-containing protein [Candidatus Kaiserbacteria bacterium]